MTRWNASTMTPPISSWYFSMMAVVVSRSLKGATSTSSWMERGMPAESGSGRGKSISLEGERLIRAYSFIPW